MMNPQKMMDAIANVVRPIRTRIMLMLSRGIIDSVDDSLSMQTIKATFLAGEDRDNIERFQEFGFASNPPDGSECIAGFVGGNREHGLILATADRNTRLKNLAKGESAIYNLNNKKVHLKDDDTLEIEASKLSVSNDSEELVSVLVELIDEILAQKTITGIGPQPLDPGSIAAFTAVKTKLETFKV